MINDSIKLANGILLAPFSLSENDIFKTFSLISENKIDDADIYFQYTQSQGFSLEEGIVKSGSFSIDQGVGVRAISGEKTAFAYSDDISLSSIQDAAKTVRQIAGQLPAGDKSDVARVKIPARKIPAARNLYQAINPIETLSSIEKIALLEKVEKLAKARDSRITQVMASLVAVQEVIYLARLDGTIAADVRPLIRLSLTVVAEEKGRRETANAGGGARLGLSYFDDELINKYVNEAVDCAITNLSAQNAPAGDMEVVLGSGWPAILLHEAVGHGLEGDFNRKGSSTFSGKIGQRVASKGVTVIDDGTLENRRGSLNIDDEGEITKSTVLIEDGILKGYLQDSLNARLMNTKSTGNGRRESYAHIPMPRMTNTYMPAGDKEPEEIISSIKKGIYATQFAGGQVDITSGKFVFSASLAYYVENGKIQYPVKGATLIGNGPESMQKISMIGNDMQLDSGVGTCGKEGQSVPVGVGQPTLKIESMTVGGTA